MNTCEDIQMQILLEQSGELENRSELNTHLRKCDECRDFRADLIRISSEAKEALPAADAPDSVVRKILAQPRETSDARIIHGPWKQVIALAACFAFIAVIAIRMMDTTTPPEVPGNTLSAADDIRALIQVYDDEVAESAMLENEQTADAHEDAVQALASDLLEMQGFGTGMGDELLLQSI